MVALTRRFAQDRLAERTAAFRVVIVNGPRQAGKTTLLRLFQDVHGGSFRSLDDATTLGTATGDPTEFARTGGVSRIIDEIQRGGDPLVLAIKYEVDQSNQRGQYILSGSTRFLTVPTLSESLAGRAVFQELWPFAMAERAAAPGDFCDLLFQPGSLTDAQASTWSRADYLHMMRTGGYPEAVTIDPPGLRSAWFDGYLSTVVLRDVGSFAQIRHGDLIPRLLAMLAARAGSPVVVTDLASGLGVNHATVQSYISYLETVFLVGRLPPWSSNLTSRHVKTAKYYPTDSGLAAHLLQLDLDGHGGSTAGTVVETFVFAELTRLLATSDVGASLHFYRDKENREIDFLLERRNGQVVGIEVKTAASVNGTDFRHLTWLREQLGERFVAGYVVHIGEGTHSFGDRLTALPLSAMWHHRQLQG